MKIGSNLKIKLPEDAMKIVNPEVENNSKLGITIDGEINKGLKEYLNELETIKQHPFHISNINKVQIIEDELKKHEQIEIPVKNYFVPGVYIREIFMPKGTVLTGKIHKYPQFHVITKGEMSILIDGEMVRLKAPINIMSPAGAKRLAIAHEDTLWLMVHGTYETDIAKIEKHFTCDTEEEYLNFVAEEAQLSLFRQDQ